MHYSDKLSGILVLVVYFCFSGNAAAAKNTISANSPIRSEREHSISRAVDGDWKTYWQTASAAHPHDLVVDLRRRQAIHGFVYIPVAYSRRGRVLGYEVFVSNNGKTWGDPVHQGEFQRHGGGIWPDQNEKMAQIMFKKPARGRYVKLRALSEVDNRDLTAVAEFAPITDKDDFPFKDTTMALLKGTRLAPSVHLGYAMPEASELYIEATVQSSAPGSYFMSIGFGGGYFGIQEKANGEKVVIFSVWDKHAGDNPQAVPEEKRVKNPFTGEGVMVKRFGGEGTGGQSFFDYDWEIGTTCRFLVKARPVKDWTEYTGYFYMTKKKKWKKLVTFSTYSTGQRLTGFHSFVEDFRRNFDSYARVRKAHFTNAWGKTPDGKWIPVKQARFTRDGNPHVNIDAGSIENGFFLQTGGDSVNETIKLWGSGQTSTLSSPPEDLP